jgi:hypothetical protein
MSEPAYPVARAVAAKVEAHFARHATLASRDSAIELAPQPDAAAIETLIDAAFWASLRREEGLMPTISLAFIPPAGAGMPLMFESSLPLHPAALARLAPAVERAGIHLGVWRLDGELRVWGTLRNLPPICFVIEVVASGLLVIKHRSDPFGKFVNVAVFEGDQIKFVDEGTARKPDCPRMVASLLGVEVPGVRAESVNVLVQIAASMRRHRRGGALLVVPTGSVGWHESIVSPILYSVQPPFSELADLMRQPASAQLSEQWQDDLRESVDAIAGLTAVDGATVINDRYDLVAFGAKISRRRGNPPVERVVVTEPVEGNVMTTATPYQLGGTRHLSAAQFVHDQRDSTALVASQDGRFTIFKWSDPDDAVHAHRVEVLLL